jgi:hypothetical protein
MTLRGQGVLLQVRRSTDVDGLSEELLDGLRAAATEVMPRMQETVVAGVRETLGRVLTGPAGAGEPPRKVEGDLQRSVEAGVVAWTLDRLRLRGSIMVMHPSGGRLEFGGLGIHPHPYYRPTIARLAPDLDRMVEDALR